MVFLAEAAWSSAGLSAGSTDGLAFASAFDDIVFGSLAKYASLSMYIGGDVAAHAQMVEHAFM